MKRFLRALARIPSRVSLWMRIFKAFKGLTFSSNVSLLVSAIFDVFSSLIASSNPRLVLSGGYLYLCKPLGLIFYVRGGTDHLYCLLPGREGPVEKVITASLKAGDVFIDVGANAGYYSILAAKQGAKVIAVEPIPETVAILKVNLWLNGLLDSVHVIPKCLFSTTTTLSMYIPISGNFGLATHYAHDGKYRKIEIPSTTLAEILAHFNRIKLVKIDAEGAEYDILLGSGSSLNKIEHLIIEISRNARKVVKYLRQNGFQVRPLGFTTYILATNQS